MLKKLRLKFICITMVIITVLLCGIIGLILHFTHTNLIENIATSFPQEGKGPGKWPEKPNSHSPALRLTLTHHPDGTLTASSSHLLTHFTAEELQQLWDSAVLSREKTGILEDYNLRFIKSPDKQSNSIDFFDISAEVAAMNALWQSCSIIGVCVWLAMLLCSILLANWAIRPVQQAWDQQRQFVADASHELKTPLTVIMTNADLLDNGQYSETEKQQFVHSIQTMSHQMRHLVQSMLELAKADNGSVRTHFEPLDLSVALSDAVLPFEAVFFERELCLNSRIQSGITVSGNEDYLKQVVEILLDNAQKYARSPGEIRLSLEAKGKFALLRLETPGTPLSKADQVNVFKRFYRVDKARSHSGSYGLGLSIAHQIVLDHKGKIWAEATEDSNIFLVQLPTI